MTFKNNKSNHFLLLYGSQTGQAEAITEIIEISAADHDLVADRYCLSEVDKEFSLETASVVVIVISSTGQGDPPDTAIKIWKHLKSETLGNSYLKHLKYALLGLGDSNYATFCGCPRMFDERLQELGASKFYKTGYADDATGLEEVVEPWIEDLWAAIKCELSMEASNQTVKSEKNNTQDLLSTRKTGTNTKIEVVSDVRVSKDSLASSSLTLITVSKPSYKLVPITPIDTVSEILSWNRPPHISAASGVIKASVISCQPLTEHESVKLILELSLESSEIDFPPWEPGDSFGFFVPNDKLEVEQLLKRLGAVDESTKLFKLTLSSEVKRSVNLPKHIPPQFTILELFTNYCDIRAVLKKKFLRILSQFCKNDFDKRRLEELSSREGGEDYIKFVVNPSLSLLDVLLHFPSCYPSLESLIENMPPLLPRFYSAANSPLADKNKLKFVFSVVDFSADCGRLYPRHGVCTGYFNSLLTKNPTIAEDEKNNLIEAMSTLNFSSTKEVKIFKRTNNHFRLPDDRSKPLILIGPGTGVGPFIGFLQHRRLQLRDPKNFIWLFFGCRHKDYDFIYKNELDQLQSDGVLTKLSISFSRDEGENVPKYVQDNIWTHRKKVIKLINEDDAFIFICGDAKGMAKDVYETLIRCLVDQLSLSDEEAVNYIRNMQDKKQYLTDVWI